ncbi:MAG: DegT/DnrJ/EryC1/StrS family aminotransferase [Treponema sp.]|jgi:dTDP-4-amino-4,6-dideoxygalactose transaminase|nr:DegT/DnrJ/EryC1/StrS family aminotransferase [Treponema sp.]
MKIEVYSPTIRRKEMDAVLTAMVEDRIGPGEPGRRLVQLAKEYIGCDYCLALRSPAVALAAALAALGLERGSGVVVSALSPRYYLKVIADLGLRPVYCDVLPSSACIGPASIEAALSQRETGLEARCIVLHHVLGFVPDTPAIAEMGIPLIEDWSRSYGAMTGEERAPSLGIFAIIGLEERDMLTAGGGALLYAMNRRDASVLRNLEGLPPEYCLPGMNAAMAMVQFKEARRNLEKRREIARLYAQSSLQTRHERFIQTGNTEYNNYTFPLILKTGMKDVKAYAKRKDIAVENAFEDTVMGSGAVPSSSCPEAYSLSLRTAVFPLYPRLGSAASGRVAKLIGTLP